MSNTIGYDLEGFANSSVTKLTGTNVTELGGSISIYTPYDSDINCTAHSGHLGYAAGNGVPRGNATIQTSVKKFGTGALYLDGTEDSISFPPTTIPSGVSAFTIEGWAYHLDSNACDIFSNGITDADRTFILHRRTNNNLELIYKSGGSTTAINVASGISNSTWYHWAVTLSGSTVRLFKDGSQIGSSSVGTLDAGINDFHFGARRMPMSDDYHQHMNGYLDDIRILKGTASYTGGFTPPSSALGVGSSTLYLPFDDDFENDALSSPTTISTSVKKYGAGSLDLNGTDEFVSYSNSDAYQFGSGDFTIEAWVYQTAAAGSSAGDRHPIVARMQHSTDRSWHIGIVENSGAQALQFSFTTDGSSSTQYEFGGDVTINNWHHVAVVRNGSTVTCYLNGTALGTTGNIGSSTIYAGYSNLTVGYRGLSNQYFQGYIDDLRIIKGYALYTSNFVAPTSAVGTTAEVTSTVVERKFLSSVWNPDDVSEKMADGTWIRNDVTSGANPAGVVVQGAGLEDPNHRWYVEPGVNHAEDISYLIVAGGGGGGTNVGGGGGAGGYRVFGPEPFSPGTYPVVVGSGAAGMTGSTAPTPATRDARAGGQPFGGGNSSFNSKISTGGGTGGGEWNNPEIPAPTHQGGSGAHGGSGGGSGGNSNRPAAPPANSQRGDGNTPPVSPPQGQPGGYFYPAPGGPGNTQAGGGGGADSVPTPANGGEAGGRGRQGGGPATSPTSSPFGAGQSGRGGDGSLWPVTGKYYSGGGGGGHYGPMPTQPEGGLGGGGKGLTANFTTASDADATFYGAGGGGGKSGTSGGGDGFPGIVKIAYPASFQAPNISGGTVQVNANTGYVIHVFTSPGDLTIN